jgi:predicted peroxiredoxin
MDNAVQAVKMLLDEFGIRQNTDDYPEGVEVVPSQIPFRYW